MGETAPALDRAYLSFSNECLLCELFGLDFFERGEPNPRCNASTSCDEEGDSLQWRTVSKGSQHLHKR